MSQSVKEWIKMKVMDGSCEGSHIVTEMYKPYNNHTAFLKKQPALKQE